MQRAGHHRGRPQDLSVIVTVRRTVVSEPLARARSGKGSAGVSPAPVGVPPTARPPHLSASRPSTLRSIATGDRCSVRGQKYPGCREKGP
jgi:hypothetical protein